MRIEGYVRRQHSTGNALRAGTCGALAALLMICAVLAACDSNTPPQSQATSHMSVPTPTPTPRPYTALLPAPSVSARAYLLMDSATGNLYLAHSPGAELPMASTTKIMTALVALTFAKADQPITVGADATALQNGIASVAWLREGDVLTLRELLYALMLPSGDDAAVAIADGVAGSEQQFITLMNTEATLLGLWHTHYANVHGLDAPGHYTTAGDLAVLARAAMRLPAFREVVATPTYSLAATANHHAYTWETTNKLLTSHPYAGVIGVKTGFTGDAGECLVFAAARPGSHLLGVVLGEPDDASRFDDATALLDWGFVVAESTGRWPSGPYRAGP